MHGRARRHRVRAGCKADDPLISDRPSSRTRTMPMKKKKYTRLFLIAGLVVLIDQLTKALIIGSLPLYASISVVPGFFNITHIHNPGGAFGFLADSSSEVRGVIFLFVSFVAVGLIFWLYRKTPDTHPWLSAGFALVFGGAIGNLIDRMRFGKVVDFLDVYIGNLHWPAFNVADSAISVGIGIFVVHMMFKKMPE
jgi:signal peptidase II